MLAAAREYCRQKMGNVATSELLTEDCAALAYFRYGLATEIASYLGETSELVKELFLYPDELDDGPSVTLPLTLIVRVARQTAALESICDSLQRDLLKEYQKIVCPAGDCLSVFANIALVDDDEFAKRTGLAVTIGSLYSPALLVWHR
jgi:hypothetical protein